MKRLLSFLMLATMLLTGCMSYTEKMYNTADEQVDKAEEIIYKSGNRLDKLNLE